MYYRRVPTRGRGGGCSGRLLIAAAIAAFSLFSYFSSRQDNPVTGETQYIDITPEQEIAHCAAYDESREIVALQRLNRAQRAWADRIAAHAVRAMRNDLWLRRPEQLAGENPVQKPLDHRAPIVLMTRQPG